MLSAFIVAHVNVSKGYRGGERQTELLIRELAKRGQTQVLVARRGGDIVSRLQDVDIEIREVGGNPLGVAVATHGADIVHVHEGRSVYGAYLRALWSGTPYILTRRINNAIGDHVLAHRAYRRAACVAAVAPQVADVVRRFDPSVRVCVIHSGSSGFAVDRDQCEKVKRRFAGKFLVGHVGALDNAQKGQEYIIRAARELQETHPDLHFLLVGGGADEEMLRGEAEGLDNLSFAGFVDNVGDYLAAFDIFILPSNREGIGGVLFDAMEQELPLVASRVGGLPDIVHDDVNGILIDPASVDQLVDAIVRLHADPELRRRLGRQGCEVAKSFTAASMCEKYLDLYRACIASPRGRSERCH